VGKIVIEITEETTELTATEVTQKELLLASAQLLAALANSGDFTVESVIEDVLTLIKHNYKLLQEEK
jgi:hypothetical protein